MRDLIEYIEYIIDSESVLTCEDIEKYITEWLENEIKIILINDKNIHIKNIDDEFYLIWYRLELAHISTAFCKIVEHVENEEKCVICLEKITDIELSLCKHRFHRICIDRWTKLNDNCPNCRCQIKVQVSSKITRRIDRLRQNKIKEVNYDLKKYIDFQTFKSINDVKRNISYLDKINILNLGKDNIGLRLGN